ncbi:MAG: sulfatase-like hydrolase/transferase, partial [Geodermatophilaceae bacterium]|nr:sulfatase-like hydrolase/transferase [Geodermatophilaceae bacterium]
MLIFTDDQRVDDMIAMPQTRALMAAGGTTFAHGYSPFPLCCPARASILSGQYAHNHGVLGNASADYPLGGWAAFDDTS